MSLTSEQLQKLDLGKVVELYSLDYSMLPGASGEPPLLFTPSVDAVAGTVGFDGDDYYPAPIKAEGFDRSTQGTLPQPRLEVKTSTDIIASLVYTHDDLLGAELTRTLVFERFLDGEPDSGDPDSWHRRDVFVIEQLSRQRPVSLEFVLGSPLDQEGRPIPRRSMLKRTCPREYRRWNGSTFDYYLSSGGCPYAGSFYYKANGNFTTLQSEDVCGKSLADCRKRYPAVTLPFGAFPSIGDAR